METAKFNWQKETDARDYQTTLDQLNGKYSSGSDSNYSTDSGLYVKGDGIYIDDESGGAPKIGNDVTNNLALADIDLDTSNLKELGLETASMDYIYNLLDQHILQVGNDNKLTYTPVDTSTLKDTIYQDANAETLANLLANGVLGYEYKNNKLYIVPKQESAIKGRYTK